jgi:hypothetical protein
MKKTVQQLEAEARETEALARRRQEIVDRYTPDTAERLSRAYHGSYYTNPEVTAALGVSDIPVDYKEVHINSAVQAAKYKEQLKDRRALAAGATPEVDPNLPYSLVDLLRMDPQELAIRSDKAPAWWDQVDPQGQWRSIPVPMDIKDAKDLLQLQEAQVVKLFLSKTAEEWNAIPGMVAKGTYNTKGERIPGTFDAYADLGAKFPVLRNMWDVRATMNDGPKPWSTEAISQNLIDAFQEAASRSIMTAQLPFKALGFAAPDHIGPAGGVEVAGINLPSRISLKGAGEAARGGVRAATTGFVAAQQLGKSVAEQLLTRGGGLSPQNFMSFTSTASMTAALADIFTDPQERADFIKSVGEGNILTQIAKAAIAGEKIDLGSGFFPEGKLAEDARKAHDAGLPQIAGQTWTLGRATVDPLIQEGYIDRNGYTASLISGIVDGVFTVVTDPTLIMGDPVQALMRKFNLTEKAATTVLNDGVIADRVLAEWKKAREAAGASTVPKDVIDLPFYSAREAGEEAPKFSGILPEGSVVPDEVEQYVQQVVDDTVRNLPLASMDNPPAPNLPILSDKTSIKQRLGVIDPNGETPRFVPREIDAMPYTREGQVTLEKLGSFNNVGELYDHFLGKIPPGLSVAIQDVVDTARAAGKQVDIKEIHRVLKDGVYSGDPLYNIREVPGVYRKWVNQTGPAVAQWVSGTTRQFSRMPGSTFFSFEDPIASVRDANRLMVVMKVPNADRYTMLSSLMKAVAKGEVSERFGLAKQFTKTIIGPALRENGVPEEFIDTVSDWAGKTDDIQQWSFDAFGRGYPTPWLADAEVLRSTDLMQKGFMMVAPEKLRQVVRETTNLWKVFEPFRGNRAMEALLRDSIFSSLEKIQANYLKPVALGAPLPIKMVTRIVPEGVARIAITESLDESSLKALGAFGWGGKFRDEAGRVNYNAFGVEIKNAKQIQKLVPKLEEYDDLVSRIKSAESAGDTAKASRLRKELNDFVAKNGTKKQIQKEIDTFNERINQTLPGTGRKMAELSKGLMADQYGDPSVLNYVRQYPKQVYKDVQIGANGQRIIDPKNPKNKNWVTGTARDLVQMSDTPEYREVARAMLAGGKDAVEQLPTRFLHGDLKPVFEEIWAKMLRTQGVKGMSATTPLTSMEGQMIWVRSLYEDILTRTASDPVAIGVVATGKLGKNSVLDANAWKVKTVRSVNVYEPTTEFRTWVQDNLLQNPNSPDIAPFAPEVAQDAVQVNDRLFTKAFSLYRNVEAKYARGPYKDYHKWKRIRELIPTMAPEEAAKMADALDASDVPRWLRDSVRAEIPFANGTVTRRQVEILGEMHGNQKVDNLLYDSSNRSYFGYRHSLLFGFFDAWVEQWSVWMRAIATQPSVLEKARMTQQGLQNTGVLYTDEDTGEQGVAIPFSKDVYSLLGLNAQERIRTKNLSLLGSAVPGFFGVGAMVMDSILPNSQAFQSLRATVFPFSDPQARSKIADYLVPAWGQGFAAALASRGGKTGTDFFDNLQQLASTETNDSIRATTANAVLTNIASSRRGVPLTADEREAIIDDAVAKTDYLLAIKALGRIFLPGASYTKYFTEIGAENVTQGQVLDDFSKMQEEATKNGGSYTDAVVALFDKYGDGAWVFLAGATQAAPGLQVTKEYAKWQSANPGLVDKYPLVAGWLGPQTGEYDPAAYRAQSSSGLRKPRDIEQRQERALNNLAWAQYNHFKDQLVDIGAKQGFTEQQVKRSADFKAMVKAKSDELKTQFPMWNPAATSGELERELVNQIRQIEKMVKDPAVLKLDGGKALQQYWDFRKRSIDLATSQDPSLANDSWRKAKNAGAMRAQLTRIGEQLVDTYPDFAPLWENILSREFEPAEIGM